MESESVRRRLRLCLHPTCRALGIQGPNRGLCMECYTVAMRIVREDRGKAHGLTDEQLVEDGKILPRVSGGGDKNPEFEYGERVDWFRSGATIKVFSEEEQMWRAIAKATKTLRTVPMRGSSARG